MAAFAAIFLLMVTMAPAAVAETDVDLSLDQTLDDMTDEATAFDWNEDSSYYAVGSSDGSVYVYDTSDWSLDEEITEEHGSFDVEFSPDSDYLYSSDSFGAQVGNLNVYDTETWETEFTYDGIAQVATFSPDGDEFAFVNETGTDEYTVYIYDTGDWEEQGSFVSSSTSSVNAIQYSPEGDHIALASNDDNTYIHGTDDGTEVATLDEPADDVWDVSWNPYTDELAVGTQEGHFRVYDTEDWVEQENIDVASAAGADISVDYSNSGDYLAVGYTDDSWEETRLSVYGTGDYEVEDSYYSDDGSWAERVGWSDDDEMVGIADFNSSSFVLSTGVEYAPETDEEDKAEIVQLRSVPEDLSFADIAGPDTVNVTYENDSVLAEAEDAVYQTELIDSNQFVNVTVELGESFADVRILNASGDVLEEENSTDAVTFDLEESNATEIQVEVELTENAVLENLTVYGELPDANPITGGVVRAAGGIVSVVTGIYDATVGGAVDVVGGTYEAAVGIAHRVLDIPTAALDWLGEVWPSE
ncbi:hypothetical protein HTZ84_21180 [Haloterrigena sp. SYSU A558-1]|uniref:Anaphase-promoting complex subunit 4-like WD40 domain-containing protein n=1 Tax=Haloterrigena gelatinilytica TaxID=2741724 RepID=A0ABX2LI02_9EURY|nr:hypothetical protein [Haloterrigena gelatinilytica]NUC74779.1 hypothetical protein [Haloterrigena gelatinilytica]